MAVYGWANYKVGVIEAGTRKYTHYDGENMTEPPHWEIIHDGLNALTHANGMEVEKNPVTKGPQFNITTIELGRIRIEFGGTIDVPLLFTTDTLEVQISEETPDTPKYKR